VAGASIPTPLATVTGAGGGAYTFATSAAFVAAAQAAVGGTLKCMIADSYLRLGTTPSSDLRGYFYTADNATPGNRPILTVNYTTGIRTQVDIGGAWKAASAAKLNVGGVWKSVSGIQQNIGSVWKKVL
jgi:hypothetical protein